MPTKDRMSGRRPSARVTANFVQAYRLLSGKKRLPNKPDWSRISPQTSFVWKAPTLERCVTLTWELIRKAQKDRPKPALSRVVDDAIRATLGVHPADLRRHNRTPPINVARQLAMCFLVKLGYSKLAIGRHYQRDKTCIDNAIKNYMHIIKGLPDVEEAANHLGPAPITKPEGPLPTPISE